MKFPQDLLRFLYRIYFKPFSLHSQIEQLDPTLQNTAALFRTSPDRAASFKYLALFYIMIVPWLLALGTGLVLTSLEMDVNWLRLVFTLSTVIALSLTLSIEFSIAFLLPFSIAVAIWSSTSFTAALGIFFSLMMGVTYGLSGNSARWGLTAGLVYAFLLSIVLDFWLGLSIGAAFLIGYFRILFYLVETSLSWGLGRLARKRDALKLWKFQPVVWDELIWFPLAGLNRHLQAIREQNGPDVQAGIHQVQVQG